MTDKEFKKLAITKTLAALASVRKHLIDTYGLTKVEAKEATKHYYKTYKRGFTDGYTAAIKTENEQ